MKGKPAPAYPRTLGIVASALVLTGCTAAVGQSTASPTRPAPSVVTPTPRAIVPPTDLVEAGTLTFGSDISYPPQEDYDPSHNPVGFDIDLGKAVAARLGLRAKFVQQNFNTLLGALAAKKFDAILSAMSITDNYKKSATFVAYFQAGQAIVVKKGNAESIRGLADLCGRKVAVPVNTPEHDTLISANQAACRDQLVGITTQPSDLVAMEKVEQGVVLAALVDSPVAWYYAKVKGTLEVAGDPIANVPQGIGILPANTALYDAVRAVLKQLIADGTYRELLERWGLQNGAIPPEAV
jgi:polar amino acid transport system substrate-binding protein